MELLAGTLTVADVDEFVADCDAVGDATDCTVQAFDARYVVDADHLERALARANRAFERGENVARDRSVETLLYAAGRRQIDRALTMGVSEGSCPTVFLVASASADAEADDERAATDHGRDAARDENDDAEREREAVARLRERFDAVAEWDPDVLDTPDSERVRSFFDVTDRELAATDGTLADAVHERVALLDVEK
ncbi:KEOPS complex subunit Cgi121 [Halobaculum sp. MBLA0147]|uniref:KEOPS complex subunit Cgi121 n=1 Tax=Halobaculum sp. MBLA0147 TaxID=3079934 RepID=UPI003525230C